MDFSSDALSLLTGAPVKVIDRRSLPFEHKFAESLFPKFSKVERATRKKFLRSACYDNVSLKRIFVNPDAWGCVDTTKNKNNWSEHALALGEEIFGDGFGALEQGPRRIISAVVCPSSPFVRDDHYWFYSTGMEGVSAPLAAVKEIHFRHEIGHVPFSVFPKNMDDNEAVFRDEVLADGFAIKTYLNDTGDKKSVRDFIHMRRLGAFSDFAMPQYWTASACEAVLRNEPLPSLSSVVDTVCDLQVRVADEVGGKNRFAKRISSGRPPASIEGYDLPTEMDALARVVEKGDLSPEEAVEGEATLKAYRRFCPAKTSRPQVFSWFNRMLGRGAPNAA